MKTLTYGNGLTGTNTYDSRYRLTGIVTSNNVQSLVSVPDANANVSTITDSLDSTKSKGYDYDNRDQLTSATGPWGSLSWGYDNVGNRLNEGTTSYTTSSGSNHLSSAGGTSYFYDNNGNTIAAGTRSYVYNQNQRLTQVTDGATSATYSYNGLGQRVKKVTNGVTTLYHYDLDGRLIVETDASGITHVEYVYLNGQPLAMIRSNNIYWYHNDHLGTPQKLTNSTKAVVWSGEFKPFGQAQSLTASVVNNLRFAGQYFDAETGLHYNYYRDYNPLVGRYVQADPIGLAGGANLYAYAQGNPVKFIDPSGLDFIYIIDRNAVVGKGHSAAIVGPINGQWTYNSFGPVAGSRAGQVSFSSESEAMSFAKGHEYTDYAKWVTDPTSSARAQDVANQWISGFNKTYKHAKKYDLIGGNCQNMVNSMAEQADLSGYIGRGAPNFTFDLTKGGADYVGEIR